VVPAAAGSSPVARPSGSLHTGAFAGCHGGAIRPDGDNAGKQAASWGAIRCTRNIISTLHSVFELAIRRRWLTFNPVKLVDLRRSRRTPTSAS
jgi:hypothetical protein